MNTPEELDRLLTALCEQLVDCSAMISDMPFEPKNENIYRVGKALAELSDLRDVIYKRHPELKPAKWGEPPTESDFEDMYQEATKLANEYLDEGRPEKAIDTYETYIYIGPSLEYENMAKKRIAAIRASEGI